ncbi:hypothetical protein pdam_00017043 [Pocillopora damicornis]|uniref:Uncharacterized protein n=1 Tax=Pocillopora damicornis TaxID=46731 RepID=A0A3M6UIN1_POCDA|nr:hypothetical protein pdam_00017043 [Pocillopora damicornis]
MMQELLGSEKKVRSKQYAPKKSKSLLLGDYQETSAALGETYDKIRSCKFRALEKKPLVSLSVYMNDETSSHAKEMPKKDGLLCFNTVVYELRDYQEEITELEKAGKWICLSKETLPFIATKGLPEERVWFVYKVLKN